MDSPPKPPTRKPEPTAREARLAQALRANLRRRKAPARPAPEPQSSETSIPGDLIPED